MGSRAMLSDAKLVRRTATILSALTFNLAVGLRFVSSVTLNGGFSIRGLCWRRKVCVGVCAAAIACVPVTGGRVGAHELPTSSGATPEQESACSVNVTQGANAAADVAATQADCCAQQASATATQAAECAAQQAGATATQAAECAAQQASATATQAAECAAQQASSTATQAAECAAQQASATATQAAECAAQQASATATQAAECAAQQASSTATQAAECSIQATIAVPTAGQTTALVGSTDATMQPGAPTIGSENTAVFLTTGSAALSSNTGTGAASGLSAVEAAHAAAEQSTTNVLDHALCTSGVSFNLTASEASLSANNTQPVQIQIGGTIGSDGTVSGGTARTITQGERLTIAEFEALEQVMSTGIQSIVVDGQGIASSGFVTLRPTDFHCLADLHVPEFVSLSLINFGSVSPLTVGGTANIQGSVYSIHDTPGNASVFSLGSLSIGAEGLWTGVLPSYSLFSGYFPSSSLVFNVTNSVLNTGVISSPVGSLVVNAGGSIANQGPGAAMTGESVTLTAAQGITNSALVNATAGNVNLFSGTGNFVNSGNVAALGNINIASLAATNIAFDNAGGTLSALNAINLRESLYSGTGNTVVTGGDLLSETLNINAGQGTADIFVEDLTGTVVSQGNAAHIYAQTDTLTLGDQNLLDPTYFNVGNISINGNISVGERLAILATGNITSTAACTFIRARTPGGVGQDIHIVAGAALTPSVGALPTPRVSGSPPSGAILPGTTVRVTGASANGGNITLTASPGIRIDASGTSGNGGNVTLLAFANGVSNTGRILLPTNSTIQTFGTGAGATNGSITVAAGRTGGSAGVGIQLGNLNANGGATTTGGSVTVHNVQPTITAGVGGGVLFNSTGSISNGGSFNIPVPAVNSNQTITIGAGAQSISAGDDVSIQGRSSQTINLGTGGITVANGGDLTVNSTTTNGATANITLTANGGINLTGGGNFSVTSVKNNNGNNSVTVNATGGLTTQGGGVTITSNNTNATVNLGGSSIQTRGGNVLIAAGDTVTLSGAGSTINTAPVAGSGGNVTVIGDNDLDGSGAIAAANTSIITSGAGTGNAGDITLTTRQVSTTTSAHNISIRDLTAVGAGGGNGGDILVDAGGGSVTVRNVTDSQGGSATFIARTSLPPVFQVPQTISFTGNVNTGGAPLTAVATGNITSTVAGLTFSTAATGDGGAITIVAGATPTTGPGLGDVNVTGRSGFGGIVDFSTGAISSFTTTGGAGGNGGNVNLAAFSTASGSATGGRVLLPTAITATTGGSIAGANGSFTVVAEQTNAAGQSIAIGGVNTTGGAADAGNIAIRTATANAPVTIDRYTGALTAPFTGSTAQNAGVRFGNLTGGNSSTITVISGRSLVSGPTLTGGTVLLRSNNGNIGTDCSSPLIVHSANLTVSAPNGSGYVDNTNTGNVNLVNQTVDSVNYTNTASGELFITSANNSSTQMQTVAGVQISGNKVVLESSNGGISLAGVVNGTGVNPQIALISSNSLTASSFTALNAGQVTLASTNGGIGISGTPVSLTANTLTLSAPNGSVFASDSNTGNVTLVNNTLCGTLFSNQANSTYDVSTTNAAGTSLLTGSGVKAAASTVVVASTNGSVGTAVNPFRTQASNLTANAAVNATLNNNGSVSLIGASSANGNFALTTTPLAGNATIATAAGSTLSAGSVRFTGGTGLFNFDGSVTATTGDINVQSNGAGNALTATFGLGSSLNATAATGDIFFNPTTAGNIALNGAGNGLINAGNTVDVNGGSVSGNVDQIRGSVVGSGSTISLTTDTGNLDIASATDTLRTTAGAITLAALNGDVNFRGNTSTTGGNLSATAGDAVFFNSNAAINTSSSAGNGGNITINANGGSVNLNGNNVISRGRGAGNTGGSIIINAADGIENGGNIISSGLSNASGGSISLLSPGRNISVNSLQAIGNGTGSGGSITTAGLNLRVVGIGGASIDVSGGAGGSGGSINVTTTSTNPFVVGNPFVNGTASGIFANGAGGGLINVAANGVNVNAGQSIAANGSAGNGGVVVLLPNSPAPIINYAIDGTIRALGTVPNTGVVAISARPAQNMALNIGPMGSIGAGKQITLGNADPSTGLAVAPSSGTLFINPSPTGPFPRPPFNASDVVINGTLPPIQPPPASGPVPGVRGIVHPPYGLLAFGENSALSANPLTAQIGSKIATDQNNSLRGAVEQSDYVEKKQLAKQKRHRIVDGSRTFEAMFKQGTVDCDRLIQEGVMVDLDTCESYCHITKGNVLFSPNRDIVVRTNEGDIHIPGGSVAFVMEDGADVAVLDMHQTSPKNIKVVSGDKLITLDPGRMVMLSRQNTDNYEEIRHQCRLIGYRQVKHEKLNADVRAFAMDFSIPSALSVIEPLKQMLASSDARDKKVIRNLLMNSVLLQEKTGMRGPFQTMPGDEEPLDEFCATAKQDKNAGTVPDQASSKVKHAASLSTSRGLDCN